MAALFDQEKLNEDGTRLAELYEDRVLWILSQNEGKHIEIKLQGEEISHLLQFLKRWEAELTPCQL